MRSDDALQIVLLAEAGGHIWTSDRESQRGTSCDAECVTPTTRQPLEGILSGHLKQTVLTPAQRTQGLDRTCRLPYLFGRTAHTFAGEVQEPSASFGVRGRNLSRAVLLQQAWEVWVVMLRARRKAHPNPEPSKVRLRSRHISDHLHASPASSSSCLLGFKTVTLVARYKARQSWLPAHRRHEDLPKGCRSASSCRSPARARRGIVTISKLYVYMNI